MVSELEVRNWARDHFRPSYFREEFKHALQMHYNWSDKELIARARKEHHDVSTYRGMALNEQLDLFKTLLSDDEKLYQIMQWINNPMDYDPMILIKNFRVEIGVCCKRDGSFEECTKAVLILEKCIGMYPKVTSSYPVPGNFIINPEHAVGRYSKKNKKKKK